MAALVHTYVKPSARRSLRLTLDSKRPRQWSDMLCQSPMRCRRSLLTELPPELLGLVYEHVLGKESRILLSISRDRRVYISTHPLAQVSRPVRSSFYDYAALYAEAVLVITVVNFDFEPLSQHFETLPDEDVEALGSTVSKACVPKPKSARTENYTIQLQFTRCSKKELQYNLLSVA